MKYIAVASLLVAGAAAQSTSASSASTVPSSATSRSLSGRPAGSATQSFSFSLLSTNPTAVPLASIVSTAPSAATKPLSSTPTAGATPSAVPGAPALPNVATLNPASYPRLDVTPPTDSAEVKQWIEEVKNSGINIPGFSPTVAGGCAANAAAAAEKDRCWWTCGSCTGPDDIESCPNKLTWGLTYDDGPSPYTTQLLEYLDSVNLKSTFFVVGSRCISYPQILQAEYLAGHQIAVHTWSHASLTTLSNEAIIAELGWSKKIIKDVLGVTPTMMRPPFGDIDNRVRAISKAMGLTPVMWTRIDAQTTFNTNDFDIHGGLQPVGAVLQTWQNILSNVSTLDTGFIVLQHDLFQQSVQVATGYITPDALAHQPPFTIKPVVDCIGKNATAAYAETAGNSTGGGSSSGGSGSGSGSGSGNNGAVAGAATATVGLLAALCVVAGILRI